MAGAGWGQQYPLWVQTMVFCGTCGKELTAFSMFLKLRKPLLESQTAAAHPAASGS
jgi:hypothetical protein